MPVFDRLVRDAVENIQRDQSTIVPMHHVSDIALGFRCVFGHLI